MSTWEHNEQLARDIANLARGLDTIIGRLDAIDLDALLGAMARDFNQMSNAVSGLDERLTRIEASLDNAKQHAQDDATIADLQRIIGKTSERSEQWRLRVIHCEEALREVRTIAQRPMTTMGEAHRDGKDIIEVVNDVLGD